MMDDVVAADGSGGDAGSGLLAFLHLLSFLQIKADPAQLLHERGEGGRPFTVMDMLRSAKRLGVKADQSGRMSASCPTCRSLRSPKPRTDHSS